MDYNEINDYLVGIFNNILIIEEASLKTSRFNDVSIKEMHTIDEIVILLMQHLAVLLKL
ncbi:hypothetical protein STPL106120_07145 [Streptococcus pluranimalium]